MELMTCLPVDWHPVAGTNQSIDKKPRLFNQGFDD
jgi:hypothetical protein